MGIKLVKVTKSFLSPHRYYCDFMIEEMGLLLKGLIYHSEKKRMSFPLIKTESGKAYSPFNLPEKDKFSAFISSLIDLVLAQPLPEHEEGAEERVKAHLLIQKHERMKKLEEREKRRGQKKFFHNKKAQAKFGQRPKNSGVLSYTPHKPSPGYKKPGAVGNRFTEIPLREPRYKPF